MKDSGPKTKQVEAEAGKSVAKYLDRIEEGGNRAERVSCRGFAATGSIGLSREEERSQIGRERLAEI